MSGISQGKNKYLTILLFAGIDRKASYVHYSNYMCVCFLYVYKFIYVDECIEDTVKDNETAKVDTYKRYGEGVRLFSANDYF